MASVDKLFSRFRFIDVEMQWLENPEETITQLCVVMPDLSDADFKNSEAAIARLNKVDDYIFYYFTPDEEIIGTHIDFRVLSYTERPAQKETE